MFPPFLNGPEISMFIPNISAPRQKFKNRLGAPESIAMMSSRLKISPFDPGVWAVGGVLAILMAAHLLFRALLYRLKS